jgi:hypothetical protein
MSQQLALKVAVRTAMTLSVAAGFPGLLLLASEIDSNFRA